MRQFGRFLTNLTFKAHQTPTVISLSNFYKLR